MSQESLSGLESRKSSLKIMNGLFGWMGEIRMIVKRTLKELLTSLERTKGGPNVGDRDFGRYGHPIVMSMIFLAPLVHSLNTHSTSTYLILIITFLHINLSLLLLHSFYLAFVYVLNLLIKRKTIIFLYLLLIKTNFILLLLLLLINCFLY